jgi:hypothetical protein
MITDQQMVEFLQRAVHEHGWVVNEKPFDGPIPGTKALHYNETIGEDTVTFDDIWTGKRYSGGLQVVSVNTDQTLLIHFGGAHTNLTPDSEMGEVITFLKEAIKNSPSVRIPGGEIVIYTNNRYLYVGDGYGDLWNFRWVEMIFDRHIQPSAIEERLRVSIPHGVNLMSIAQKYYPLLTGFEPEIEGLKFFHAFTYQRIG